MSDDNRDRARAVRAEQVFLALAREWRDMAATAGPDCALPEQADTAALACLLLSVEWGAQFTEAVNQQLEENEGMASSRWSRPFYGTFEALVWNLCRCGTPGNPAQSAVIDLLLRTLINHSSAVRTWAMDVAWMVRPWLPADEGVPLLLKNVADTLGGVRDAMGLARSLCATDEELEKFIAGYSPPDGFADQFAERITMFRREGFALSQRDCLERESRCRGMIEKAVFRV